MIFFCYLIISIILFEKTKYAFLNECQFKEKEMKCDNFSNFAELNFSSFSGSNVSKLVLIPIEYMSFDMDSFSLSELNIMPNSTLVLRQFNDFPFYFSDLLRNFSILDLDNSSLKFSAKPISTTSTTQSTTFEFIADNSTNTTPENNSTTNIIIDSDTKESINTEYIINK